MTSFAATAPCGDPRCFRECDVCTRRYRDINRLLRRMSNDELLVVETVASRFMEEGRMAYGALNLERDTRHFASEARDELLDAVFYLAADNVGLRREREDLLLVAYYRPRVPIAMVRAFGRVWRRLTGRLPG